MLSDGVIASPAKYTDFLPCCEPGAGTGSSVAFFAQSFLLTLSLARSVVLFSVSIALSFLNYRGLHIIGNAAVASTVYIIIPFVVLAVLALPHVEPRHWVHENWTAVQWSEFINVMFW